MYDHDDATVRRCDRSHVLHGLLKRRSSLCVVVEICTMAMARALNLVQAGS
jgi:hypothetical protein